MVNTPIILQCHSADNIGEERARVYQKEDGAGHSSFMLCEVSVWRGLGEAREVKSVRKSCCDIQLRT